MALLYNTRGAEAPNIWFTTARSEELHLLWMHAPALQWRASMTLLYKKRGPVAIGNLRSGFGLVQVIINGLSVHDLGPNWYRWQKR